MTNQTVSLREESVKGQQSKLSRIHDKMGGAGGKLRIKNEE
jgi:hypothetical protein